MNLHPLRLSSLVVGVLLHAAALDRILRGSDLGWALLAHVAGAAIWGFGLAGGRPGTPLASWWLPAGCALVFPLWGPLASFVLQWGLRQRSVGAGADRYLIWNQQPQDDLKALPESASFQSIMEILQSPRTEFRRNAILALRELEPPMAIPLLRKGLQDSDEQVRIYAQNILSGMLEGFEERIKELEAKLRATPTAAATAHRLAEQFFELVYLDVAGDDETAAHYLSKAITLLEHAAAADPTDPAIAVLGLKYALRARQPGVARNWCARLPTGILEAQHVLPWRMELAFLEGDWRELGRLFTVFTRAGYINPRIDEVIRFWRGEAEPAA